jgi:transposase
MDTYEHYIGLDWAQKNMAIARMTKCAKVASVIDVPADLIELKIYLKNLSGKKILTFEETTTSQWLYTELKSHVNEILVCDPYRNKLLSDGPKNDKVDAIKLVQLLKAGLLKPVFHSGEEFIYLRKLTSGYEDLIQSGVRLKNQRSSLFRARGRSKDEKWLEHPAENFVLQGLDEGISVYEKEKDRYEKEFNRLVKKHQFIRLLTSIPGIGPISAVKIVAIVVDPGRFREKGNFLSYCGLVKHDMMSGGRSYGKKTPRHCRALKAVFKICTFAAISERANNPIRSYYEYLLREKKYADYNARNATCRWVATLAWAVLKGKTKYQPRKGWECNLA